MPRPRSCKEGVLKRKSCFQAENTVRSSWEFRTGSSINCGYRPKLRVCGELNRPASNMAYISHSPLLGPDFAWVYHTGSRLCVGVPASDPNTRFKY